MTDAFTPDPETPADLERAIADAEAEVERCTRAVLEALDEAAARAARDALTDAEARLDDLLDRRPADASCEGWP